MKRRSFLSLALMFAGSSVALGLSACESEEQKAQDVVSGLLSSYVVPERDESGEFPEDAPWPASDFGDAATMEQLRKYGVDEDEWHEHCFKYFGFEVGEAAVDGNSAQVSVTVTNNSFADCSYNAAADFNAFTETSDCEATYESGGRGALFDKLVDYLYARLDAGEFQKTVAVTVPCAKDDDGNWVPQVSGNAEFFNALYGGANVIDGLTNVIDTSVSADADVESAEQ